jgi:hypothetical protein
LPGADIAAINRMNCNNLSADERSNFIACYRQGQRKILQAAIHETDNMLRDFEEVALNSSGHSENSEQEY